MAPNDQTAPMLKATQLDRDEAHNVLLHLTGYTGSACRDGEMDDYWLVQTFARHRLAAISAAHQR